MKKLMMLAAALMLTGFAHTAFAADNLIRPILGFKSNAVDFGVDYEKRMNHDLGWGAYFFYGSEHKDGTNPTNQDVAFGLMAPIHVLDNGSLDAYIAPGVGIAMIKGLGGADDETTFGPSFKIGAEWKFSPTLKGGVQYFQVYNWFSDKAASQYDYASLSLGISF